jgi:guanylate kinase
MIGVILYGPPASGKDTVTEALHELDGRYVLFPRLKVGAGKTAGYRMTNTAAVEALRVSGEVIWENRRYDAIYVIDRPTLLARLRDHIPVLHLGQPDAIVAVVTATPDASWLVAALWCPRPVAEQRLRTRGTGDLDDRLRAWDETPPPPQSVPTINTAEHSPDEAARSIHRHARQLAVSA